MKVLAAILVVVVGAVSIGVPVAPSSAPTMPLLFDPPLSEDCDRVRAGEGVAGQDLWIEHNFDIVVDVAMGGIVGLTETMRLLEQEMQQKLILEKPHLTEIQIVPLRFV